MLLAVLRLLCNAHLGDMHHCCGKKRTDKDNWYKRNIHEKHNLSLKWVFSTLRVVVVVHTLNSTVPHTRSFLRLLQVY